MRMLRIAASLLMVCLPAGLSAQQADTLSAASVYAFKYQSVIKPLERAWLDETHAATHDVSDVLRHFTGVQVKDYGGTGGLKTVNVRSLGSEHVGIFIDGIQVENAQNMQVDLGRLSTDSFASVELYTGQKIERLQTAKEYASGAAVHLQTYPSIIFGINTFRARFRTGSFGTVNPSVSMERVLGKNLVLRTSGEFLTSNGKYKYPYFDTTLVRENGDIRSLRLEAQLINDTRNGDWNIRAWTYGSERGFPGPVIRRASGFPFSAERQADQDFALQGGWKREWTNRYATSVKFKYSNDYLHYDAHPEKNPMALPYNFHYRQQAEYLSLAQSLVLTNYWTADLSTDIQHNSLESDAWKSLSPRRTVFTGALATRYIRSRFRAAASLVYLASGEAEQVDPVNAWMPSVNFFWQISKHAELDAFAKRSYRLPSFNDLYYSQLGNPSLLPESASQVGADLRYWDRRGRFNWKFNLSPYYNKVKDKIVAIPTSSQFRWTMLNIGQADIAGLDVHASGWIHIHYSDLGATLRYSLQHAIDHSTPGSTTYGNQLPYIPLHSGSVTLTYRSGFWYVCWDTSIVGERWSRSANTDDYRIAPWAISEASATYQFQSVTGMSITLKVGNFFNQPYQIIQGYPMPGRNFLLSLEYKW